MGNATLGNTAGGSSPQFWFFANADMSIKGNETLTAPESLYIDTIHVFGATKNGGSATAMAGVYNPATGALLAFTPTFTLGTSIQYYTASFAAGSYYHIASGGTFKLGLSESGQGLQTWGRGDGGTWDYRTNTYPLPNPFGGTTQTGLGNWPAYVTYFKACQITAVSQTPVAVGDTFTITGRSFTAGVTGIILHGVAGDVAVTSYSVDSDTQITATLPAGASYGPVEVDTNAGAATSSQNVLASGGFIKVAGVVYPLKGTWYKTGGVIHPEKGAWYKTGGFINPAK